ncbi:hypothetical protein [Reichenbachiella sp.]|uniref:hypothetical protein n=1 Tax=Reichenbachiella sp. TaxID=2184521 RepID=UPI003BB1F8DE
MKITKVISYKGAWDELVQNHQQEIDDIENCLEPFFTYINTSDSEMDRKNPRYLFEEKLSERGWTIIDKPHFSSTGQRINIGKLIGPVKNEVSATVGVSTLIIHDLSRWLFHQTTLAIKYGVIKIPILLVPSPDLASGVKNKWYYRSNFDIFHRQLDLLAPLSHPFKFVIASYSNQLSINNIDVIEIESDPNVNSKRIIDRCIEFPPEYHQAGLSILNFFGTYLRENYPEEEAKVRIEQDGLRVRLIIEKDDGESEVVEKALQEYELIVTGKESPEKFATSEILILELKNELRMAQFRIDSQRDIISLQNSRIDKLIGIVGDGLSNKAPISIDFRPSISTSSSVILNDKISTAIGTINELKNMLPTSSPAFLALNDLEGSLEAIESEKEPEIVKNSTALNKFKKIIDNMADGNTELGKAIKVAESGWELFKDLSGKYNRIAEWCGLPQVPSVFTNKCR